MLYALTLVGSTPAALRGVDVEAVSAVARVHGEVKTQRWLAEDAVDLVVDLPDAAALRREVDLLLTAHEVDGCLQPAVARRKRLLVADMDSTIIGCECLDELADYAGVRNEVAEVTERAMRGELAFEPALRARVARLAGLSIDTLAECLVTRVRLNPGARVLVRTMATHGAHTMLVSGGFEAFTGPVAAWAGFAEHRGNRLVARERILTGDVEAPILGREAKLAALQQRAGELGLDLAETLAVGDGANDLAMIEAAGLGVAYRAKPRVAAQADARVDHASLEALLYFQGYASSDFIRD